MSRDSQISLFDVTPEPKRSSVVGQATVDDEVRALAQKIPSAIRFGTSSWSFPGWEGIVYDRRETQSHLAKHGLRAYAKHPLLRAVGVDRTYYAPMTAEELREYGDSVGDEFRFLVKAAGEVTNPYVRNAPGRYGKANASFLDAGFATDHVIGPTMEGLGAKAGPLVFQFPPVGRELTRDPARFAGMLAAFLVELPSGPWYAVELRDHELLSGDYMGALESAGATHCVNVHPRMPSPREQANVASGVNGEKLAIRWMLHSGLQYEEARDRYSPFDRLVDEDSSTRSILADLAIETKRRGGETVIVANNKAEGSAPLSLVKLAKEIVVRLADDRG